MDFTGDGAKLYGYVAARDPPTTLVPVQITRELKQRWVPRIRGELEAGSFALTGGKTFVYSSEAGSRILSHCPDGGDITREMAAAVVEEAFARAPFRLLRADFLKVRREHREYGMSYETVRDETGHGDSFWAALLGVYAVRSQMAEAPTASELPDEMPELGAAPLTEMEFLQYLRGS